VERRLDTVVAMGYSWILIPDSNTILSPYPNQRRVILSDPTGFSHCTQEILKAIPRRHNAMNRSLLCTAVGDGYLVTDRSIRTSAAPDSQP
jgi:hypothetical protein